MVKCPNCGHKFNHDILEIYPDDPIMKTVKKHMDECDEKFKAENPCPKCGSHNVDCDLMTPMWCNDCGHEW